MLGAVRSGARRFLQRPGATVDLGWARRLLPAIDKRCAELDTVTDQQLRAAADKLRQTDPERLDPATLVEVCALARQAAIRALDERLYDSQLLAAAAMMSGQVAELATGEGKTLAAVPAVFGLVVRGMSVHVLTVNDYLARRDAEWMAPVYRLLGVQVGWVDEQRTEAERRTAYGCDVTYGSISEVGFDFLRDGLVTDAADRVQGELSAVLVDEADSILVDEARIPMVLAGNAPATTAELPSATEAVAGLRLDEDYTVVGDRRAAHLTDAGLDAVEKALDGVNLYDDDRLGLLTAVNLALSAKALVRRDVEYLVRDGRVELVDEFRGRVVQRRRWPDGLQAAVEAKEGLPLSDAGEVLNTITVQAFLRQYPLQTGMTATAVRVGEHLREFYELEVAAVAPHRPCIRVDGPDHVYATRAEKEAAIVVDVLAEHELGRPVLLGTQDVAESERLADELATHGVDCAVLNARNDRQEAEIIAEAGAVDAVTVSTQMAGRGVDIRLGGSDGAARDRVAELGGLYVLGCGRHESRRVDDQLRGRAGRQGDPGESNFVVSLEDDLITEHGSDALPGDLHPDENGLIDHPAVRRVVEHAQRVAEGANQDIHRQTWRYHQVIELQRQRTAERRAELLSTDAAAEMLQTARPDRYEELADSLDDEDALRHICRLIVLYHTDDCWSEHLARLNQIREGIHLRALGRQDPLDEFHRLAIEAFGQLTDRIDHRSADTFDNADITGPDWDPADDGLERPTATWTYLTTDNPFGSELDRALHTIGRAVRGTD